MPGENVRNIQQLKIERFEGIYSRTRASLFNYIKKFAPVEDHEVEDVVQESYIRLWENLHRIKGNEDPVALLRTYAINFCINHLKKTARQKLREKVYYAQMPSVPDIQDEIQYKYTVKEYRRLLESMPQQRRMVYQLVKENNLSYKEISEKLGISTKTVERHINEALRTLRNKISMEQLQAVLILIGTSIKINS